MVILLFWLYFNKGTNSDQTFSLQHILLYTYKSIEFQSNVSVQQNVTFRVVNVSAKRERQTENEKGNTERDREREEAGMER